MNQTLLSSFGTAFERVEHALDALREGRGVMVLDDEDRAALRISEITITLLINLGNA